MLTIRPAHQSRRRHRPNNPFNPTPDHGALLFPSLAFTLPTCWQREPQKSVAIRPWFRWEQRDDMSRVPSPTSLTTPLNSGIADLVHWRHSASSQPPSGLHLFNSQRPLRFIQQPNTPAFTALPSCVLERLSNSPASRPPCVPLVSDIISLRQKVVFLFSSIRR